MVRLLVKNFLFPHYEKIKITGKFNVYLFEIEGIPSVLSDKFFQGRAILYDVKKYDNKTHLIGDKNSHYADPNIFDSHMYGFILKNAQRLKHPILYSGKLGFFEVNESNLLRSYE
jgi:hypothetical protein